MEHYYALILAGGTGSRLWPLSRPQHPKPLLALTEERSLFHMTVDRLQGLFDAERLFVVTRRGLDTQLLRDAPQLSAGNFLCEPSSRDTAPAVGVGVMEIARRDSDAVIAIVSSDHHIGHDKALIETLQRAYDLARRGYIVTLGVLPTRAATEFGYIQHGEAIDDYAYGCQRFIEKPDAATAQAFLEAGGYSWDAGILIASARSMIAEFERKQPAMTMLLRRIIQQPDQIDRLWPELPAISLDYAIMEHAQNVAVIPVNMDWSDVGSWDAVYDLLPKDEHGNAACGSPSLINTHRTLIRSPRRVVTIGVDDLIIVDTQDALLICKRGCSQLVAQIGHTKTAIS